MRFLLLPLLLISLNSFSQQWYNATDTLKSPRKEEQATGGFAWVNGYDTVSITYITIDSKDLKQGYRLVYSKDGYYTDNRKTYMRFFDSRKKPLTTVRLYYFN